FAEYLEEKCRNYFQGLYYQVPNIELERSLVRVSNDRELSYMFDIEKTFGRLELYIDHLDMDLLEYLSQAITNEIDVYVSKIIGHPKKRVGLLSIQKNDKGKEKVSQDETEGVKARTNTTYKGKEKVSQDETEGVEARTSTVDSDYDSEFDSDDDSEYDSYNSVDYLSSGKEELIKFRNRMKANREAKIKLKVGEKYATVEQLKECLTYYALANGFSLWYKRISGKKVVAKCGQIPPRLFVPDKGKQRKQSRNFNFSSLVNYKGIGKVFGDKIRANPDIRLCDIDELVMKKYKCKVTPNQCTNAKKYALTEYEKFIGEYYMLRSYRKAILDSNPGSMVMLGVTVNPDDKAYFDSPNQGEILIAIGRDGNNHIYPVAWAVVNVENKDNWSWFLELLEEDLGCNRGNGLTLMSDQHKGLIEAVKDVMPNVEHMQCARHIYENFRKNYSGLEFKNFNWATSKASYPQLFNKIMDKIESVNPNAH
ncbi:multidrug resistance-associated protein 5, partial [Tanacetum coccineum]